MKLSVIIPVYNEARTVRDILKKAFEAPLPPGVTREIIVVNDKSTDGTREILEELKDRYSLKILDHVENMGKGRAIKNGLVAATGDFAIIQDADLEYDPADYSALMAPLLKDADIVFGSRYLHKNPWPMLSVNYLANRILTSVSNMFTGYALTDMETCYKVFSRKAINAITPYIESDRFDIEPELTSLAAVQGFDVVEVPVSYDPRTARQGKKIKWHDGFPALIAIFRRGLAPLWKRRKWELSLLVILSALIILFGVFLGPHILGDTPSYLDSMNVMNGAHATATFMPNRLLTTFGSLETIRALSVISGSVLSAWFFLNAFLYMLAGIFFYKLLVMIFKDRRAAFFGCLFLAANYGFMVFGLNYLMDIGGWAFYIFTLYFLYKHSRSHKTADLGYAALMVGLGGLCKEYGFLGSIAIAVWLIIENRRNIGSLVKKAFGTAGVALIPTAILYVWVYHRFGYTYLDWFGANQAHYIYTSRIVEYVKSLGSLFNLLALPVLAGLVVLIGEWRRIESRTRSFIIGAFLSFMPVFFWPAITQRIMTITVPFALIVACFAFKRWGKLWWLWSALLALYILATFYMDSYLLGAVNLPF